MYCLRLSLVHPEDRYDESHICFVTLNDLSQKTLISRLATKAKKTKNCIYSELSDIVASIKDFPKFATNDSLAVARRKVENSVLRIEVC